MDLYFGSTSERFLYGHYLAVISAVKTQQYDNAYMICTVIPNSPYFDLIKNKVTIVTQNIQDFPMLKGKPDQFRAATMKDYIEWSTLYENGGLFMDLDTLSISDMTCLLGNFDVVVTPDTLHPPVVYEAAAVLARKNSIIVKDALGYTLRALSNPKARYTSTGPIAFTRAVLRHKNLAGFPGYDTFGPRIKKSIRGRSPPYIPAWLDVPRPSNTRMLHLYASSSIFDSVDADYIMHNNTMYARTVKQVLTEQEWKV